MKVNNDRVVLFSFIFWLFSFGQAMATGLLLADAIVVKTFFVIYVSGSISLLVLRWPQFTKSYKIAAWILIVLNLLAICVAWRNLPNAVRLPVS